MLNRPHIVERTAQPYAAVRRKIGMSDIATVADSMSGELFSWLGKRNIQLTGAPFFKYNSFGPDGQLEIEWGAPVPLGVLGDSVVLTGTLAAGRYVSVIDTGPFKGLRDATGSLLEWIEENDLELDKHCVDGRVIFGCRLELYLTDPRAKSDLSKWQTEITMRLADET